MIPEFGTDFEDGRFEPKRTGCTATALSNVGEGE